MSQVESFTGRKWTLKLLVDASALNMIILHEMPLFSFYYGKIMT